MPELIDLILRAAVGAVAAYCLVACICRLDVLHLRKHEAGWVLAYILQGGFAAGTGLRVAFEGLPGDAQIMGLVAAALFLRTSRKRWGSGAPQELARAKPPGGAP